MIKLFQLFSLIILVFFVACASDSSNEKTSPQSSNLATPVAVNSSVTPLDADGLKKLLTAHQGKILFINVWATWCVPCKEEFPDLVKLADTYKGTEVEIVGLSVDYADEVKSRIIPFLNANQVNFPQYVQNFKEQEDLINLLNKDWRGAVPATFIYDKNGQQKSYLLGQHNFEEFKAEIERVRSES
jgi:thiol-disulfide isomerase/thioredoxin